MNAMKCTGTDLSSLGFEPTGNYLDVITEGIITTERRRYRRSTVVKNVTFSGFKRTTFKFDHTVKKKEFCRRVLSNADAYHDIVRFKPCVPKVVPSRRGVYAWGLSFDKPNQKELTALALTESDVAKALSDLVEKASCEVGDVNGPNVKPEDVTDVDQVFNDITSCALGKGEELLLPGLPLPSEVSCDINVSQVQHAVETSLNVPQSETQAESVRVGSSDTSTFQNYSGSFLPLRNEVCEPDTVVRSPSVSASVENESVQKEQADVLDKTDSEGLKPLQGIVEDPNNRPDSNVKEPVKSANSSSVPPKDLVTYQFKDSEKRDLHSFFIRPSSFETYDDYNLSRFPASIRNNFMALAKNVRESSQPFCKRCRLAKSGSCEVCKNLTPEMTKKRSGGELNKTAENSPEMKTTKKSKMNGEGLQTDDTTVAGATVEVPALPRESEDVLTARRNIKDILEGRKEGLHLKLKGATVHFGTYVVKACSDIVMTKLGVKFAVKLKDGSEADIVVTNNSVLRCVHCAPVGIIMARTGNKWSTWIRNRFGLPKTKQTPGDPWFDSLSSDPREINLIFRFKSIPKTAVQKMEANKLFGLEFHSIASEDASRFFAPMGITIEKSGGNGAVWKASVGPVTGQSCRSPKKTTSGKTPAKGTESPKSTSVSSKAKPSSVKNSQNPVSAASTPVTPSETLRKTSSMKPISRDETQPGSSGQKMAIYLPDPNKEILQRGTFKLLKRDILTVCPEQLLNDTMIDFWLDHFWKNVLGEEDRQRSHIFSTFFYSRLTQKDNSTGNSQDKTEAEKRHSRVSRWTRKVDIFAKDFVIVPINEACHWYVAVICFPGLVCPEWLKDGSPISGWTNLLVSKGKPSYRTAPGMPERFDDLPSSLKHRLKTCGSGVTSDAAAAVIQNEESQLNGTTSTEPGTSTPSRKQNVPESGQAFSGAKSLSTEGNVTTTNRPKLSAALKDMNISKTDYDFEQRDEATGDSDEETLYAQYAYEDCDLPDIKLEETEIKLEETEIKTEDIKAEEPHSEDAFRIRQPCIIIFDSLPGEAHAKVLATLREYLQEEYKLRKQKSKVFDKFSMPGLTVNCPQQQNFYDCGIYVLEYVEQLFKSPLSSYLLPLPYTLRNWFGQLDGKRKEIYDTIQKLVLETKPENVSHLPAFEVPPTVPSSSGEIRTPNSTASGAGMVTTTTTAAGMQKVLLPTGKVTYKLLSSSAPLSGISPAVARLQYQPRTKLVPVPKTPKDQGVAPTPTVSTPVPEAGAFETTPEDTSPMGVLSEGLRNTVVISTERSSVLSPPPEVQTDANPEATDNPRDIVKIDHNYMSSSSESSSQQSNESEKHKSGKGTPTSRRVIMCSSRRIIKTADRPEKHRSSTANTPDIKPKSPASRKKRTRTSSSSENFDGLNRLPGILGSELSKLQTVEPEAEPMDVDI